MVWQWAVEPGACMGTAASSLLVHRVRSAQCPLQYLHPTPTLLVLQMGIWKLATGVAVACGLHHLGMPEWEADLAAYDLVTSFGGTKPAAASQPAPPLPPPPAPLAPCPTFKELLDNLVKKVMFSLAVLLLPGMYFPAARMLLALAAAALFGVLLLYSLYYEQPLAMRTWRTMGKAYVAAAAAAAAAGVLVYLLLVVARMLMPLLILFFMIEALRLLSSWFWSLSG